MHAGFKKVADALWPDLKAQIVATAMGHSPEGVYEDWPSIAARCRHNHDNDSNPLTDPALLAATRDRDVGFEFLKHKGPPDIFL